MGIDPITLALAKNYTNSQRLAYVETVPAEIIEDGEIILSEDFAYEGIFAEKGISGFLYELNDYILDNDTLYKVSINGKEPYYVESKKIKDAIAGIPTNNDKELYLGNLEFFDLLNDTTFAEDTKEPFIILQGEREDVEGTGSPSKILMLVCNVSYLSDDNLFGSQSVTIQKCTVDMNGTKEIVHQIDPKYYERLAWEEKELVEICNVLPTDAIDSNPPQYVFLIESGSKPIIGDVYTFIVNGVEYKLKCKSVKEIEPDYIPPNDKEVIGVFGNIGIINPELGISNEPFLMEWYYDEDVNDIYIIGLFNMETLDFENQYVEIIDLESLVIKHEETVVHKIDPKYYDRLAWTEDNVIELMSETVVPEDVWTPFDFEEDGIVDVYMIEGASSYWNINLKAGDKYIFVFDGKEYNCTVDLFMEIIPYMGNQIIFNNMGDDSINCIDNGMPFTVIEEGEVLIFAITEKGTHTIAVYKVEEIVHKVDKKYLPEYDMSEVNPLSPNYIKNKELYKGIIKLNRNELISMYRNTNIDLNMYPEFESFAKISEYVPYNQFIDGFKIYLNYLDTPITSDIFNFDILEDGSWNYYSDFECVLIIAAFSEEQCSNLEGIESGIYFCVLNIDLIDRIEIPLIKQLDKSLITQLDYKDLKNIPCGVVKGDVIKLDSPEFSNYNSMFEEYENYSPTEIRYFKISDLTITYEQLIGSTLYFNDGSQIIVDKKDVCAIPIGGSYNTSFFLTFGYLIKGYLLIYPNKEIYKEDIDKMSIYYNNDTGSYLEEEYQEIPRNGIYTSFHTGKYITFIKLSDEVKQLDSEYIPVSTENTVGGVKAKTATVNDIQPVSVNDKGELFIEPIAYDGNVTVTLTDENPIHEYNVTDVSELVGITIKNKVSGRRLLDQTVKPERLSNNNILLFEDDSLNIVYSDAGVFSTPALIIEGSMLISLAPSIPADMYSDDEGNDVTDDIIIFYLYETTTIEYDGMFATLESGWYYTINMQNVYKLDPNLYPVYCYDEMLNLIDDPTNKEYIENIFVPAEEISFVVSEKDICTREYYRFIGKGFNNADSISTFKLVIYMLLGTVYCDTTKQFTYSNYLFDSMNIINSFEPFLKEYETITYPYLKKIDPKFLPDEINSSLITDEEIDALDASIV